MGSPPKKKRSCAASAQRGESPKRGARDTKKSGNVLRQGGGPPSARVTYTFIEAQKTNHRISRRCKVLRVSKSGFYGWRGRAPSARAQADALLTEKIVCIHTDSRECCGLKANCPWRRGKPNRAREFYEGKLGLRVSIDSADNVQYRCAERIACWTSTSPLSTQASPQRPWLAGA